MKEKIFAHDLDLDDWRQYCQTHSFPKFAALQIYQWIFQKGNKDPKTFTNLSNEIRNKLSQDFEWEQFLIDSRLVSQDGSEKILLKTHDNLFIELVLMPYESRVTVCISSQVGCRMGCTFCQTAKMGLSRSLSSGEIVGQILYANRFLEEKKVSNVVFMGMGEPLDNFENVVKACKVMCDPVALSLSPSKVTVSTSGLVPEIEKLGAILPVRLAISLHSTDDKSRSEMMPVNRKYPLSILKEALLRYPASKRFGITFEYVMIEGKNDSLQDAKKLVKFLHGLKAKVNLIPLNHFPGTTLSTSSSERILAFQSYLSKRSIPAPVRYSRGQDISGGCGQLAAKRKEELHLDPRTVRQMRKLSLKLTKSQNGESEKARDFEK